MRDLEVGIYYIKSIHTHTHTEVGVYYIKSIHTHRSGCVLYKINTHTQKWVCII